jgi:phytoene synthase
MSDAESDLPPPARLAVAYAPRTFRKAFSILLRLDARFASIVSRASEPLIGQMKLAWWRDALLGEPGARPKGEPLLAEFAECSMQLPDDMLEQLISAWEMLLVADDWSHNVIEEFGRLRGQAIFNTYASIAGAKCDATSLGIFWAINDLRIEFADRVPISPSGKLHESPIRKMPRPLSILAMSVKDVTGPRLVWHALTGR